MEIQPQDYNIWAGSQTRNGFAADEIISSLQKAIRRAMEEQACQYAYELYVSGPIFLKSSGADFLQSLLKTLALEI